MNGKEKLKFGTLVYIKSSVTAPMLKPFMQPREEDSATEGIWGKTKAYVRSFFVADDTDQDYTYDTYKYKIYHPAFPHESTADQFFDPVQWESYYQLGQFIGADVLGLHSHDFPNVRSGQQYVLYVDPRTDRALRSHWRGNGEIASAYPHPRPFRRGRGRSGKTGGRGSGTTSGRSGTYWV